MSTKFNKSIAMLLSVVMVFTMLPFAVFSASAEETVVEISSYEALEKFAKEVSDGTNDYSGKTVKLADNFPTDGTDKKLLIPIGSYSYYRGFNGKAFKGNFDGNKKTVNLEIDKKDTSGVGMFACTDGKVEIKNLTVSGSVMGKSMVGGIIGYANDEITLTNCHNKATVSGLDEVGGLIGNSWENVVMTDCTNSGTVSGSDGTTDWDFFGGLIGEADDKVTMTNCTNSGDVEALDYVGGLVGWVCDNVTMTNCANSGDVEAFEVLGSNEYFRDYVGGFIGEAGENVTMTNCTNSGDVESSGDYVGGFIGEADENVTMTNCADSGDVESSGDYVGGMVGYQGGGATYKNCYHAGQLTADNSKTPYGICGCTANDSTVTAENCYYETEQGATQAFPDKTDSDYGDTVKGLTTAEMKSEKVGELLDLLNTFVEDYNVKLKDGDVALSEWVIKTAENSGYPMFAENGERTAIEKVDFSFTVTAPKTGEKLAEKAELKITDAPSSSIAVEPIEPDWRDDLNRPTKTAECNGEYTVNFSIDTYAHGEYKFTENTAVTATVNGKKATIEGDYETGYTVSYTFDKVQHVWDDGKVVKNATKNHGAVRLFTCTVCGAGVKTAYLPQSTQTIKLLKKKYTAKNNTVKIKAQAKGSKLRFRVLKKSKYYRVNKYGRIRFRNGAKGTYKIKVKITALVNNSYKQAKVTKVIKVKVK